MTAPVPAAPDRDEGTELLDLDRISATYSQVGSYDRFSVDRWMADIAALLNECHRLRAMVTSATRSGGSEQASDLDRALYGEHAEAYRRDLESEFLFSPGGVHDPELCVVDHRPIVTMCWLGTGVCSLRCSKLLLDGTECLLG